MDRKMLSNEQKKKITDELSSRIKQLACPMCHNLSFILADAYFNNSMQSNFKGIEIGGPSIPTIGIICSHCGFVSQHALGILGLLPKQENIERNEPVN